MTIRVAHLIAPVKFGGGEALLTDMISSTSGDLNESVITVGRAPLFRGSLAMHGIPVRELGGEEVGAERRGRFTELWRSAGMLPALHSALRAFDPHIIHAHGFPPSLMASLPLRPGARRVYTHHYERRPPRSMEQRALTFVFNRYDALTTPADHLCAAMNRHFPSLQRPFTTLRIGLADRLYEGTVQTRYRALFSAGATIGVCVGRLVATKNQMLIITALASLPKEMRGDVGVLLVGEGPQEPYLRAAVAAHGLDDTVRFLGQVDREEIPHLLASVDFAVFPTTTEASSVAAAEALAAGLPILSLDIPAMRETVGPAGLFCQPEGFAAGLLGIASRAAQLAPLARQQGERSRASVVRDDWFRLYRRVLAAPNQHHGRSAQ